MLIARSILARIRPPRLSPREIQDQLDITQAAVLTAAYANARKEQPAGAASKSYGQIEKEIAALKPSAVKKRAQTSLNDQVVTYFNLVHAAKTALPPPAGATHGGENRLNNDRPGEGILSTPSSSTTTIDDGEAEETAERTRVEAWRRNLLREMLRAELGFSIVVKESGVPGGGSGLFVDGSAPEGAVVAIFPGLVHLPEHLANEKHAASLLPDDDFFLMGRADGCLIDGRTAGSLPSSPLTFAHAANHPPAGRAANVLQVAYDFPALGETDVAIARGGRFPERLRPFVPNRYFKPPKALFGGKLDLSTMVETVVLVTCRGGLHDEEVLMDYRFNPRMPHPEWYSPVDPDAAAKMWATDKRDRTAQALLEKPWFRRTP